MNESHGMLATPPMQTFCTAGNHDIQQPTDIFLKAVKTKQPDVLMIQNVRGMLRPNRHAQFKSAEAAVSSLNYTCYSSEEDSIVIAFRSK